MDNVQLTAWRESRNLTQRELGDWLGVDQMTVSRWERGASKRMAPGRLLELALWAYDKQRTGPKPGRPRASRENAP